VTAAHMTAVDENLRHGAPSAGAVHHLRPLVRVHAHIDFMKSNALALQKRLGAVTIRAHHGGINFNGGHEPSYFRLTIARYLQYMGVPQRHKMPFRRYSLFSLPKT